MATISLGLVPSHYADLFGPDEPCLTYPDGQVTWSELESRSNRRARMLKDHGVSPNDFVTVALENSTLFHEVCFSLWKLGATPHVVSPRLPMMELKAILELLKPTTVIGADSLSISGHPSIGVGCDLQKYPDTPLPPLVAKHWKAMSSGGSTGRPKIIVDHAPSEIDPTDWLLDMPQRACVLNPGPLYHNAPFMMAHHGLFRGNHVVGLSRFDALETLQLVEKFRPSWVMMVPTMMHRIWRLPEGIRNKFDLSSLKVVGHVASPMPVWLKEAWIEWLGADRVYELYGGTEGTGATWIRGDDWLQHKGSVGKFIREAKVRVLNTKGEDCEPREIGEVYLMPGTGPGTTYHYIGAEAKMVDGGWETLGDMGWLDEDGYLYLADRRTDLIISGGANIYPAEIEAVLAEHPAVDTAVAIGLPDEDLGQIVHAIVQVRDNWPVLVEEGELRGFLEKQLVRYKTPRTYEFVTYSLRDDAGKVRRSELRNQRVQKVNDGN
ncbi:MAG: Bile acid-coenzyme A ligase [Alphaproteobacteria bacterium MarineAlpha9_Bin7]|nr:MAG: Bile acid-coenzyme A ligase [Alphaproteobacteria bacterium MarineAlpha9_Bin7]